MSPPGTQILFHQKRPTHRSWAPHEVEGWYIGPATKHYLCFITYITKTYAEIVSDTVVFLKQQKNIPILNKRDILVDSEVTLTTSLSITPPFGIAPHFRDNQLAALQHLVTIFKHATYPHTSFIPISQRVNSTLPNNAPLTPTNLPQRVSNHIPRRIQPSLSSKQVPSTNIGPTKEVTSVSRLFQPSLLSKQTHLDNSVIFPDTGKTM